MNFEFWYHPYFGKQHLHTIIEEYTDLEIKEFGKDLIDTSKINLIPFYWENKLVDSRRIIDTKEFSDILIELDKNDFYLIGDFSGEATENYSDELWDKNLNIIFSKCKKNRFLIIQNNFDIGEVKEIYYGSYNVKTIHLPYFILSTPIFMNDYISDLSQYENLEKKKDFICLNRRVKKHKFLFLRELYNRNLIDKTYWTYVSNYVDKSTFNEGSFTNDMGISFEDFKPIQLTGDVYYGQELDYKDEYLYTINPKWYFESKVDLVVETFNHNPCHITEKVLKPIYLGVPFVVYSSKNYLDKLKEFGFKDYTSIIGKYNCNNIDSVIDASIRLKDVYNKKEVIDIINYNKNLIRNKSHLVNILNNTFFTQLKKVTQPNNFI